MKKILLATTMLVGTAGFAAAEVTLSGNGRMGVTYNEATVGNEVAFNSRVRASISMSSETDGGLSFGGSFGVHDADDGDNAGADEGLAGSVYIEGAFGKLSMGDVSSAAENAVGDLYGVGYTGIGDGNEMTYITTGDNEMALYSYSAGAFTGFASVGQPGTGTETTFSIAGKYDTGTVAVSLGYEDNGVVDHIIGGVEGSFDAVKVKAIYGSASDLNFDQYGLSVSYTADALGLRAYYLETDTAGVKAQNWGLGASYDLGGGATLAGGIADINGNSRADLGVNLSF